eukprot:UN11674
MAILPERREKQQRLISSGRRESIAIDEMFFHNIPPSKAETIHSTDASKTSFTFTKVIVYVNLCNGQIHSHENTKLGARLD